MTTKLAGLALLLLVLTISSCASSKASSEADEPSEPCGGSDTNVKYKPSDEEMGRFAAIICYELLDTEESEFIKDECIDANGKVHVILPSAPKC